FEAVEHMSRGATDPLGWILREIGPNAAALWQELDGFQLDEDATSNVERLIGGLRDRHREQAAAVLLKAIREFDAWIRSAAIPGGGFWSVERTRVAQSQLRSAISISKRQYGLVGGP